MTTPPLPDHSGTPIPPSPWRLRCPWCERTYAGHCDCAEYQTRHRAAIEAAVHAGILSPDALDETQAGSDG